MGVDGDQRPISIDCSSHRLKSAILHRPLSLIPNPLLMSFEPKDLPYLHMHRASKLRNNTFCSLFLPNLKSSWPRPPVQLAHSLFALVSLVAIEFVAIYISKIGRL